MATFGSSSSFHLSRWFFQYIFFIIFIFFFSHFHLFFYRFSILHIVYFSLHLLFILHHTFLLLCLWLVFDVNHWSFCFLCIFDFQSHCSFFSTQKFIYQIWQKLDKNNTIFFCIWLPDLCVTFLVKYCFSWFVHPFEWILYSNFLFYIKFVF